MKNHISIAACASLFACAALNLTAAETVKLDAVDVQGGSYSVSQSGIDEGILNKEAVSGPLAGKKIQNMPYQINTLTRELMDNQIAQQPADLIKFFPSAQLQYRFGPEIARPETRGFQAGVVGNMLWDGFYVMPMISIPMVAFETMQVQNGLAGSLYGGQSPSGIFNYIRKRPVPSQHIIFADYVSRGHLGWGLDTSDRFEKVGYRGVVYYGDGQRQVKDSVYRRKFASIGLDFYLTDALTLETNYSYFEHDMYGLPTSFSVGSRNGVLNFDVPSPVKSNKKGLGQPFAGSILTVKTASAKLKYELNDDWNFEGGYHWYWSNRNMNTARNTFINANGDYRVNYSEKDGGGPSDLRSYFAKALGKFETGFLKHDFGIAANGFHWMSYSRPNRAQSGNIGTSNIYNPSPLQNPNFRLGGGAKRKSGSSDMNNVSIADEIAFSEHFSTLLSVSKSWFKSESISAAGMKKKNYSKDGNSYAASLIYKPNEDISFYVTYADSINVGYSYSYPVGHPKYGETVYLDPTRSKQYEIGAKARIGETDVSTALFRIERPIAYESVGAGGYTEFSEQGKQVNQGFEMTAGGKLTENLSTFGGFMLLDARLKQAKNAYAENKFMIGQPKFRANLLLDYTVPNTNKLAFSTNFHYSGKQYVDETNTHDVGGYFLTDVGVRYSTKAIGKETTLRFNVNNVFDKKHWVSMMPGSVDGMSNNTMLFLGQSRTFMLSAQVKF